MSTFYTVRLRRFLNDDGFTGGERDLKNLQRTTDDGLPINTRVASLNVTGVDNNVTKYSEEVIMDVSPTVGEARQANYVDRPLPGPQGVVVYQHTNNRRFSVSARFVSRTLAEATNNYIQVNLLRSWMIPQDTKDGKFGKPPLLRLNGYKNQFYNIPTVLSSLSINFPEDVDYIETDNAMVPIIQTVDIELIESHSLSTIKLSAASVSEENSEQAGDLEFDLNKFKQGILPGY